MKVSELQGVALDWAVAKCENNWAFEPDGCDSYSTDWELGGPIIERERINVYYDGGEYWCATTDTGDAPKFGPTPLVAAMRCYVASQLDSD